MTPQYIALKAIVAVWSTPLKVPVKILSLHIHFVLAVLVHKVSISIYFTRNVAYAPRRLG